MLADISFFLGLGALAFGLYECIRILFLLRELQEAERPKQTRHVNARPAVSQLHAKAA